MSIRPVSRCLPTSQALWDDTNLPFCIVVTPCQEEHPENEEDVADAAAAAQQQQELLSLFANPLSAIPKCLHCGAPHPTSTTHFRPQYSSQLLCFLCGKVSSTIFTDQESARRLDEYLDEDTYDKISMHTLNMNMRRRSPNPTTTSAEVLDFRVPLEVVRYEDDVDNHHHHSKKPSLTWQLPAMACPPVWWIVVDGTVATSTHGMEATQNYWTTVGAALEKVLEDIPPFVHVGLLTPTTSRLLCWVFSSTASSAAKALSLPEVKHLPYSTTVDGAAVVAAEVMSIVPANEEYKPCIVEAIRAMVGAGQAGSLLADHQCVGDEEIKHDKNSHYPNATSGFPLATTIETVMGFMEQAAHPGQVDVIKSIDHKNGSKRSNSRDYETEMRYAGGKILCLIGNPPLEVVPSSSEEESMANASQPAFHQGGVAGACFADDDRDKWYCTVEKSNTNIVDATDITASNLAKYATPLQPEDMFEKIGRRCAEAAMSVDLMVLVPQTESGTTSMPIPWYGLPVLRALSDASGAPGPLMCDTTGVPSKLIDNILARTPWQDEIAFGGQLRLRVPPGFEVEDSPVERESKLPLQLAPFLSSGGLMGPARSAASTDADPGLWIMGTSDPYTSYTIDLQAAKHVEDRFDVDGFGEVALRPVIQTCFAYTCIETDGAEENPSFYTVRKMRISNLALPLVDDAETIYDALDLEALAAVLFHKISLDAFLTGFWSAQKTAESWLCSLLLCVYHSAQAEQAKFEEEMSKRQEVSAHVMSGAAFVSSERLLDQDGDLEAHDVLLGYGHSKVAAITLLVYALMQCDALRPSQGEFRPSMDSRLCALAQMASMPPSVLSKAIAPSVLMWSLKDDEAILESLPLSMPGIAEAIQGLSLGEDVILLMDSPRRVLLLPADYFLNDTPNNKSKRKAAVKIGPDFAASMLSCLKGFRTMPANWKDIEILLEGKQLPDTPRHVLHSFLLEDKPVSTGFANFSEWKMEIALIVQEDLEKSGFI